MNKKPTTRKNHHSKSASKVAAKSSKGLVMTAKSGLKVEPTDRNAEKFDDNPEWTDKQFKTARPAHEVLPELFGKKVAGEMLKSRGRPKKEHPKVSTTIRIDEDVLEAFKAGGPRWQARMNTALREWVSKH